MAGRTVELWERIDMWRTAFEAVRQELTPTAMRTILTEMNEVEGVAQLASYMQLANGVMANDRMAAEVAARLMYGVRPESDA